MSGHPFSAVFIISSGWGIVLFVLMAFAAYAVIFSLNSHFKRKGSESIWNMPLSDLWRDKSVPTPSEEDKPDWNKLIETLETDPEALGKLKELASHIPQVRDFLHKHKTIELQQQIERAKLEKELQELRGIPPVSQPMLPALSQTIEGLEKDINTLDELRQFEIDSPKQHPELWHDATYAALIRRKIEAKRKAFLTEE